MKDFVIENRPDSDNISVYYQNRLWNRSKHTYDYKGHRKWTEGTRVGGEFSRDEVREEQRKILEHLYRKHKNESVQEIPRFPRLGLTTKVDGYSDIPLTAHLHIEPTQWLVDGLIARGSINLLVAPPGGFKTWFGLSLSQAVSRGLEFIGCVTRRTKVLYLDFENPLSVICERAETLHLSEGEFLRIWGHWLKDSPPMVGDRRLGRIARQERPLIVIDSLIRSHSANEDKADQMAWVMEELRFLADDGATILGLHHPAKSSGSKYRGSSDILAGVDAAFELIPGKNDTLKLECFKHRYIEEPTLNIRFDFENGRCEVVDDPSNAIPVAVRERIMSVIEQHPGIAQKDLLKRAELPETNGRKALQKGEGVHWDSEHGRGKTLRYYPKSRES